MLEAIIKQYGGTEVTALDVYSDVFKFGEGYIQKNKEDTRQVANPLGYYKEDGKEHGHYRIMFEDSFPELLQELQEADFALLNGITYWGRKNTQQRASKLFAFIIDFDGITDETLKNFFSGALGADVYPIPQYMVLSGHNCHLYYVLEEPISLFPQTKIQLKELKYALTRRVWNPYTSTEENPQYQGINQSFRVIGGKSKIDGTSVRAFRLNDHPTTVEELSCYVPEENRVVQLQLFKDSKYTLEEARKKFPKWYEKVIVNGDKTRQKWDIAAKVHGDDPYALYHWWIKKIYEGAIYRHRYFSIMALVIYGIKCDVPKEKIIADIKELQPYLTSLKSDKPFTDDDIKSALDCLDDRYATFPIRDIEKLTSISIPRNKRNSRKQYEHLRAEFWIDPVTKRRKINFCKQNRELALQDLREAGEIHGRPKGSGTKKEIVKEWQAAHPGGKKIDCEKETGLSRHTVLKWWK